jgi:hypothetical protein
MKLIATGKAIVRKMAVRSGIDGEHMCEADAPAGGNLAAKNEKLT